MKGDRGPDGDGTMSPAPASGPSGTSRWPFRRIAYVLAVTAFGAGIPTPLYAVYEERYGFNSTVLAEVFAAYTLGVLVTMLVVAPMSDTIGPRPILGIGMALTAASGVAFIFATGATTLALARVVSGLSVGATTSTATAWMSSLEPRHDDHHVARVSVAANFGAVGFGVLLSGVLVEYGPDPTKLVFLLLIGASVVGLVAVGRTREEVPVVVRSRWGRARRPSVPSSIRRTFWVAAVALAACYAIYGYFGAMAPTFLRGGLGVSNIAASAGIISLMFGLAAIVQLGLGEVRDRRALLIGLPLILAATFVLTLSLPLASIALLGGGAAVLGVGVGFAYMGSVTLIDRVAPSVERGEVLSAFFVVGYLSLAIPTIGIGITADRLGLLSAATLFGVALGLSVAVLYLFTLRTPTPPGGEGRPREPR